MWGGTYTLYNLVRKRAYNILKYILELICYERKLWYTANHNGDKTGIYKEVGM
jgi:hypothetical protein